MNSLYDSINKRYYGTFSYEKAIKAANITINIYVNAYEMKCNMYMKRNYLEKALTNQEYDNLKINKDYQLKYTNQSMYLFFI